MDGPISLQFNASLLKGAESAAYPLDQSYRHPVLIEEVRFAFSGYVIATRKTILHQLSFGLQFGSRVGVLDEVAPLPSFCRRLGEYDQGAENNFPSVLDPRARRVTAVWKLPSPVFVPEGARLYCLMKYDDFMPNASDGLPSIQTWVTLVGTALPRLTPTPDIIRVPWVVGTKTTPVAFSAGAIDDRLSDDQLQNSHKEPVVVQRMLGSMHTQHYNDEVFDINVRVYDTTGAYIVRDPTPMLELFNGRTRCWDMGTTLKPKEFISVEYAGAFPTGDVSGSLDDLQPTDEIQLIFGLVGYREVPGNVLYPKRPEPTATRATPSAGGGPLPAISVGPESRPPDTTSPVMRAAEPQGFPGEPIAKRDPSDPR